MLQVAAGKLGRNDREVDDSQEVTGLKFKVVEAQVGPLYLCVDLVFGNTLPGVAWDLLPFRDSRAYGQSPVNPNPSPNPKLLAEPTLTVAADCCLNPARHRQSWSYCAVVFARQQEPEYWPIDHRLSRQPNASSSDYYCVAGADTQMRKLHTLFYTPDVVQYQPCCVWQDQIELYNSVGRAVLRLEPIFYCRKFGAKEVAALQYDSIWLVDGGF